MNDKGNWFYRWLPLWIFLGHLLLCFIAFKDFRMSPGEVAFGDGGDGLKNNFTLLQYVKEKPGAEGFLHFRSFLFPYGDAIWYTDNTPLFAIPFKAFCHYIYDASAYTIPVYYLFIILNIPVCGLFCYKIIIHTTRQPWVAFAGSIFLPWLTPMLLRVPYGHYNLSLSALIAAAFWLLLYWQNRLRTGKSTFPAAAWLTTCIFIGFLCHGYYLAILAAFVGLTLLAYAGITRDRKTRFQAGKAALLIPGIAALAAIGLVTLTDPYHGIRNMQDMDTGYDWMELKIRFTSLFSGYSWIEIPFPIQGRLYYDTPDRAAYLGTGVLMALLFVSVRSLFSASFRRLFIRLQRVLFHRRFTQALAVASFLLLMISFGENYYTTIDNDGLHFTNLLNPFYYIHKITRQIENFRALERFVWPFWVGFVLWSYYTVLLLLRADKHSPFLRWMPALLVLFFSIADLRNTIDRMQGAASKKSYLSQAAIQKATAELPKKLPQCAAILPIPFYMVGSESKLNTIDDIDEWSRKTYQWTVGTGMPILASKMSRTPLSSTLDILRFVKHDSLSRRLYNALGGKPILVALNRDLAADSSRHPVNPEFPEAKGYYFATLKFAERQNLQPVDSAGPVLFYLWYPPATAPLF